ncbi:MAG: tRNA 2-thiouridine(34) synthase MnmA, partial [Candidatus Omnitrophica bacterium]|nr:tRNA 2-thiouridine(34) synthase MnmA [Candidatus Omnitrophota bacterium]
EVDGDYLLCRPKDSKKDQTYFLYSIKKANLSKILFPLSDFTKDEIRDIAHAADLTVESKLESQDVCFVPDNDYKRFVSERIGKIESGDIVNMSGDVLGKHKGIINYTRGQRGGLGVAVGRPQYVVEIDAENNRIIVGEKEDLLTNSLIASNVNMLIDDCPQRVFVQIRYGHKQALCSLDFIEGNKVSIVFDAPQEAVTKGQSVVFYNNNMVLGGGTIESYSEKGMA